MIKNKKNITLILFSFLFSLFIIFNIINIYKDTRINNILDTHTSKIQTYYEILSYNQKITADITFEETMQNKEFISLLKKANNAKNNNTQATLNLLRNEAIELLEKKYKLYKKKGILQYHFVFPDNIVFLRMHKTNKFGDDLTKIRTDFAHTNKTLAIVRGFAQGRTSHAFRNVYPIIVEGIHLGAMEVSFSSELLQDYFTKVNKIDTHFLVRKDIFETHAWERDDLVSTYLESSEHENYMMTMTGVLPTKNYIAKNEKRIKPIKEQIKTKLTKNKKFSLYLYDKQSTIVSSFFPVLHNITKEPSAWIVSYVDEPLIAETLEMAVIMYIGSSLLIVMIFAFIYYILNQKYILNSAVKEKTQHLRDLNIQLRQSEHKLLLSNEILEYKVKDEVQKNRQKDKILHEQAKMAALGEMIGNIAHQWRQPLSVISTSVSGMIVQKQVNALDDDKLLETCHLINKNTQYLSKTIDDFRNFIIGENKKEKFILKESFDSFFTLIEASRKKYNINLISNINKDLEIFNLKSELNQCLINLFNNSKDILVEKQIGEKVVFIKAYKDNSDLIIEFKDNGGGIHEKIIHKIFEPYFTTKHQSQGTGLGLNMTYSLIVKGMNGNITVSNDKFIVEDKSYYGACFTIKIPIENK